MPTTAEKTEEPAEQTQRKPAPSIRHVLKNRNFLLIWLAQLISLTVLNAANFGFVVIVNDVTHSALMSGLAIIAFTLPAVPFSAVAGVLVDRLDKRMVLWISNVLRAVTTLLMVGSLLFSHTILWPLFVLIFLASLIGQFFTPAESASIPLLVGERELMPALSLFNITMTVSMAIGFLVLGRLIASIFPPFTLTLGALALHFQSIDMLFVIVALFYLVCAGLIFFIPPKVFEEKHLRKQKQQQRDQLHIMLQSIWRDLVNGWRVVHRDHLLLYSVIQLSLVGVLMLLVGELAGPFVQQVLHRSAADISFIFAPAALGLVGAAVVMPRFADRINRTVLSTIGLVAITIGFLLIPSMEILSVKLDPTNGANAPWLLWGIVLLMGVLGMAMSCVNIPTQTMMQERAPENSRGRVFAFQFMLYNAGSIPVLLFAGVFAQFIGLEQLMYLLAFLLAAYTLWGIWYSRRNRSQKDLSKPQDEHAA